MKATILDYTAVDNYGPADEWKPNDPERFVFQMEIIVSLEGTEARELFHLTVCTPSWIATFKSGEVLVGKRYILTDRFDWPKIKRAIDAYVEKYCVGSDADEVNWRLRQLGFQHTEDRVLTDKESKFVIESREKLRRFGPDAFRKNV